MWVVGGWRGGGGADGPNETALILIQVMGGSGSADGETLPSLQDPDDTNSITDHSKKGRVLLCGLGRVVT